MKIELKGHSLLTLGRELRTICGTRPTNVPIKLPHLLIVCKGQNGSAVLTLTVVISVTLLVEPMRPTDHILLATVTATVHVSNTLPHLKNSWLVAWIL